MYEKAWYDYRVVREAKRVCDAAKELQSRGANGMSRVARSYQICKSREADIERDQLAMGAMAEVCKRRVRRWADAAR